jgi:hypothetical protein
MDILPLIIIVVVGVWLIALSGVALHETVAKPGKNYDRFVKYFAGISIVVAGVSIGVAGALYKYG